MGVKSENIVALCDVDDERAAEAIAGFPKAARYRDFRQMLEREKIAGCGGGEHAGSLSRDRGDLGHAPRAACLL